MLKHPGDASWLEVCSVSAPPAINESPFPLVVSYPVFLTNNRLDVFSIFLVVEVLLFSEVAQSWILGHLRVV